MGGMSSGLLLVCIALVEIIGLPPVCIPAVAVIAPALGLVPLTILPPQTGHCNAAQGIPIG